LTFDFLPEDCALRTPERIALGRIWLESMLGFSANSMLTKVKERRRAPGC
jgi:hypothetical protein